MFRFSTSRQFLVLLLAGLVLTASDVGAAKPISCKKLRAGWERTKAGAGSGTERTALTRTLGQTPTIQQQDGGREWLVYAGRDGCTARFLLVGSVVTEKVWEASQADGGGTCVVAGALSYCDDARPDEKPKEPKPKVKNGKLRALLQGLGEGLSQASPSAAVGSAIGNKLMLFGGSGHETFLGCLNCPEASPDSVHNEYGRYGSPYQRESIFNRYGPYGSEYSQQSTCSPYASDPPVIVDGSGRFFGRLTVNAYHRQASTDEILMQWLKSKVCN